MQASNRLGLTVACASSALLLAFGGSTVARASSTTLLAPNPPTTIPCPSTSAYNLPTGDYDATGGTADTIAEAKRLALEALRVYLNSLVSCGPCSTGEGQCRKTMSWDTSEPDGSVDYAPVTGTGQYQFEAYLIPGESVAFFCHPTPQCP